jgi:hypothetical protein
MKGLMRDSDTENYLRQTERDFLISPSSGLYEPKTIQQAGLNVSVDANILHPLRGHERPRGSFFDAVSNIISGVALLVSLATLIGLVLTAKIAFQQWQTMDKTYREIQEQTAATDRAARAAESEAKTSSAAFGESKKQFQKTVDEMDAQISTAQNANGIAAKALAAQTRPWVGIPDTVKTTGPPSVLSEDPASTTRVSESVTISFTLKDYGNSPATSVAYQFFIVGSDKEHQFRDTHVCEDALSGSSKSHAEGPKAGLGVFPGEVPKQTYNTGTHGFVESAVGLNFLVGCIVYYGQGRPHVTTMFYRINRQTDATVEAGTEYRPIIEFDPLYTNAE